MSVKSDRWIRKMALEHRMIEPFTETQVREGVISYGLSSYGYDVRIADEFKIFTNINHTIVDPKDFDPRSFVDFKGERVHHPARTPSPWRAPSSTSGSRATSSSVCVGKSHATRAAGSSST